MRAHWSTAKKVQYLLTLPWTVAIEVTKEGERIARIHEVPRATAKGHNNTQVAQELWKSLAIAIEEMVHAGLEVPLPDGVKLPWLPDDDRLTGKPRLPGGREGPGMVLRGAGKNRPAPTVSRVVRLWATEEDWQRR